MDYTNINQVINDIIELINYYNKNDKFSYECCEKLVVVLLGYYLIFGCEIFEKINIVLEQLEIHDCDNENEYVESFKKVCDEYYMSEDLNPLVLWDYKYNSKNKFIGAIPHILFIKTTDFDFILTLSHELFHCIDGTSAKLLKEDEESFEYSLAFTRTKVRKSDNFAKIEDRGFGEMVAVCIENRIAKILSSLDIEKIESPIVKKGLLSFIDLKNKDFISSSYSTMSALFMDLYENDKFLELIKKYYVLNDEDSFIKEYNDTAPGLDYSKLKRCASHMYTLRFEEIIYYQRVLAEQIRIFNNGNKDFNHSRILILV